MPVVCFQCNKPGSYDEHGHSVPWTEKELGGPASNDELKAPSGYFDPVKLAEKTSWRESGELVPGCVHGRIECEPCWNARTRKRGRHEHAGDGLPPFSMRDESADAGKADDGWWSVLDEVQP